MKTIKLTELQPDERNANRGTVRGLSALDTSLRNYGAGRSIVVDREGRVIAGNKTLEQAIAAGFEDVVLVETDGQQLVAVQRVDLDLDGDEKARLLAYADNRVGELDLSWDGLQIAADLEDGFDLSGLWDDDELSEMLEAAGSDFLADIGGEDVEPQVNRAEELRSEYGTELGQVWQLGDHRIVCGDCTDAAVVAEVMGGERFNLCATSPPYLNQREYNIGDFDWLTLANGFSDCAFAMADDNSNILVNLGLVHEDGRVNRYWEAWLNHCEKAQPLYGWYIWDKGFGLPGDWHGRLAPAHEFVFHFRIGKSTHNKWVKTQGIIGGVSTVLRRKDGSMRKVGSPDKIGQPFKIPDSVIRITRINRAQGGIFAARSHPAVFPVEFAEFFVKTWSLNGDIIYEPFLGSGTMLVACENLGRHCRAAEIDPGYVAVALHRWKTLTGREPELLSQAEFS